MTARLIPEDPDYVNYSERSYAEALRDQLPDDAVMFINQRFTDHEQDREADVIVAWPGLGIAVIEVKGGSVSLADQQWRQRWQGDSAKKIDPVGQARRAKYWLRNHLDDHPRWTRGRPRLAHMIALTATALDDTFTAPTDAPRWMSIDRTDVPHAAARIHAALKQAEGQPAPPSQGEIDQLVDCLAGAMIPQRDLLADLAERENTCELLSKDQANVLDMLGSHTRVEIRGGAGSGKTWLAVEKAGRLAAAGKRVALMCYSRGLAEFLTRRVAALPNKRRPAYVGTFHSLGTGWGVLPGAEDDSEYWEEELPQTMVSLAAEQPYAERFDAIVIDEAQDFAEHGGPPYLPLSVTQTVASCTCSPTRTSGSSPGRGGRPFRSSPSN